MRDPEGHCSGEMCGVPEAECWCRCDICAVSEITDRWQKATQGPWFWGSYSDSPPRLMGRQAPQYYVMGFTRMGMQGAAPLFRSHDDIDIMKRFDEYPLFGTVEYDSRFNGIDNPDAQAIAHSPEDIRILLKRVKDLEQVAGHCSRCDRE